MSRFVYANTLAGFLADHREGRLLDAVRDRYEEVFGHRADRPEVDAWRHSLPALAGVLGAEAFQNAEIFVELFMPLDNRRCDALLTGRSEPGRDSAVVVELKQWSAFSQSHLPEHVHAGGRQELHPSIQVRGYVETLRHFHSAFTDRDVEDFELGGCVFMHNMKRTSSHARVLRDGNLFGSAPQDYPVFFTDEQLVLERWLARRLAAGSGRDAADRIKKGVARPSPRLLDHLVDTVQGTYEWRLLDEQRTVYWSIRQAVQVANETNTRRVIVVRGGPGTGKSVLAIQLLADAARQHWIVAHATGSKAFQTVLQARTLDFSEAMLKRIHNAQLKKHLPVDELFTTFAEVAKLGTTDEARFELVVCDEAHRLWEHRRMKYPNGTIKWLTETSMIEELIRASRVTAFFLDDNQSVRSGEIGRSDRILETAAGLGIEVQSFDLSAQFRCAGSESYIAWVEHLFGHRAVNDLEWRIQDTYTVKVWSSMPALDAHLRGLLAEGARVRLIAGYCWKWSKPDANGTLPKDLTDKRFGGWSGSWIAKTGQFLEPRENRYNRWANDPEAYDEVGSIYSAQGFEFDHVGVIWAEDLVWRGGKWVHQIKNNRDGVFKKELKEDGSDTVEKLLNVYRVLLTRGMRSTHLFILDDETRAHVERCLSVPVRARHVVNGPPLELPGSKRPRITEPTAESRFSTCVPLIPLRAAAGGFSAEQLDLDEPLSAVSWVTWDGARGLERGMFAARVVGKSMEPDIPSGSLCLFRPCSGLATTSRPVLLRHAGPLDADTGGQFTVKDVVVLERRAARKVQQIVELRSRNPSYSSIVLASAEELAELRPIAELVDVLGEL